MTIQSCSSCNAENDHQPFPITGRLAERIDFGLTELKKDIVANATVYYYVVESVKNRAGAFVQYGCAPNWQGDYISLCTCKYFMRTFLSPEDWIGKWVAGFAGVHEGSGKNALVFLMCVGHAFGSHHALWSGEEIPQTTKQAKSASHDPFGDLFEPGSEIGNKVYSPLRYLEPCSRHVHQANRRWILDINYPPKFRARRRPALLIGAPESSYIWTRPLICFESSIGRGQRKTTLRDLLDKLEPEIES